MTSLRRINGDQALNLTVFTTKSIVRDAGVKENAVSGLKDKLLLTV
jgi:hypothetical protein